MSAAESTENRTSIASGLNSGQHPGIKHLELTYRGEMTGEIEGGWGSG